MLEDLEQLIDFVLIEFQRVLFAENIVHTIAVRLNNSQFLATRANTKTMCSLSLPLSPPTG